MKYSEATIGQRVFYDQIAAFVRMDGDLMVRAVVAMAQSSSMYSKALEIQDPRTTTHVHTLQKALLDGSDAIGEVLWHLDISLARYVNRDHHPFGALMQTSHLAIHLEALQKLENTQELGWFVARGSDHSVNLHVVLKVSLDATSSSIVYLSTAIKHARGTLSHLLDIIHSMPPVHLFPSCIGCADTSQDWFAKDTAWVEVQISAVVGGLSVFTQILEKAQAELAAVVPPHSTCRLALAIPLMCEHVEPLLKHAKSTREAVLRTYLARGEITKIAHS